LISRNGNPFASFADLATHIAAAVPNTRLNVLDGKIVCVDKKGGRNFGTFCCAVATRASLQSICWSFNGKDCSKERLVDRK
jgi:ATP-dependent DNA ligase